MFATNTSPDFTTRLQETMHQVLLDYSVTAPGNKLFEIASYALAQSGKMVRGRMLLEVFQAVANRPELPFYAATALEYLHLGTLIHDDIIDGDELRRGRHSVWHQYDRDLALLNGDLFYFLAFQTLARDLTSVPAPQSARVLSIFASACAELCLGQTQEERLVSNCAASYADYLEVVRLKTASLFRATLEMGTLLGGGSEEQVQSMGQFAEHLGLGFQIIDDLLPFTSDAQTLGKPVTSDIKNHRLTAPMLYALTVADESERKMFQAIFEQRHFDERLEEAHALLSVILEHTGAVRRAEEEALSHYHQAMPLLQVLPAGAGREHLTQIANQLVQRRH